MLRRCSTNSHFWGQLGNAAKFSGTQQDQDGSRLVRRARTPEQTLSEELLPQQTQPQELPSTNLAETSGAGPVP